MFNSDVTYERAILFVSSFFELISLSFYFAKRYRNKLRLKQQWTKAKSLRF